MAAGTVVARLARPAGAVMALAWLACCAAAAAHEGPPYPILMDQPIEGCTVSVWADPDVGKGTFYIIAEPADGNLAKPPRVELWVQPLSRRLEKVTYQAELQNTRGRMQFYAEPQFDRQERWETGIVVHLPSGDTKELVTEVDVTPPGLGRWDLAVYLFPFVLFGGLWGLHYLRYWRSRTACSLEPATMSAKGQQG